jgi:transcriptional regulator with XRE-family HTH domain/tetratricopeptide (TPR) repeat protein
MKQSQHEKESIHPLRQERQRRNLTQRELAELSLVSLSTIQRAERGEPIRVDSRRLLCKYLGKDAQVLGLIAEAGELEEYHHASLLAHSNSDKQDSSFDISHIVGREDVVQQLLAYLETPPGKPRTKLSSLYGITGAGKSSVLTLLRHHLLTQKSYLLYFYAFDTRAQDKAPDEHLDNFLANLLDWLHVPLPDRPTLPPLQERVSCLIAALIQKDTPFILLLDDLQIALGPNGHLTAGWQQVLQAFVETNHAATLYAASRKSLWHGKARVFVREMELEPLSTDSGVQVWHNLGFVETDETLLRQATEKCGGNPGMMEIVAQHVQQPVPSLEWHPVSAPGKAQETRRLAQFVDDPHILSHHLAIEAYPLIDEIVNTQLSHEARDLLRVLALAPVPLAPALLRQLSPSPEQAYADLRRTTLLSREYMRLSLPPLVAESVRQQLPDEQIAHLETRVIEAYTCWIAQGTFLSDHEQGEIVAELLVLYLHRHHLFTAAQLLIEHGWLCIASGHTTRLSRIAQEVMAAFDWQTSEQSEAGGLLVTSYLSSASDTPLRQRAYLRLYNLATTGNLALTPRVSVYIVHHYLRHLVLQRQFADAWACIEQTCAQYHHLQDSDPIAYAELLDQQGYIAGRWGDDLHQLSNRTDEAASHWQKAVHIHTACHDLLLRCEKAVPSLRASDLRYKRARILHDTAFYQRCLGDLDQALATLHSCLALKEQGYSLPTSLAISYDDLAHLLVTRGRDQEALTYSDRALALVQPERAGASHRAARRTQGMLLINRGELLARMGKWEEARAVLAQGLPLVEGTSRAYATVKARKLLEDIQHHIYVNPHHTLDKQWFSRYRDLASYSDVAWLRQAGPLTEAERKEVEQMRSCHDDPDATHRFSEIIMLSRNRELVQSALEQREPRLTYPAIPLSDVLAKEAGLSCLRSDIEECEQNEVVRHLYLEAIDERITELRLIEAVARTNDGLFWEYSQVLNPIPDVSGMEPALSALALLLHQGLQSSDTHELSQQLIAQTHRWRVFPLDLLPDGEEPLAAVSLSAPRESERTFSPDTAQRFFEEVFRRYHFPWTIVQDAATDHAYVNFAGKRLILPKERWMGTAKIRELLAHEIEVHAFRAVAGAESPLSLLSLGLEHSLETEEGLAVFYAQETAHSGTLVETQKTWIGTLATGLAAGIMGESYTFRKLLAFLTDITLLRSLLTKSDHSAEDQLQRARRTAQNRCLRTFRGVTDLTSPGICSTKDHVYLRGYLAVSRALERQETTLDQLMVGVIGLHHLSAMSELGIVAPAITHRKLALDIHLEEQIAAFAE